MGIQFFLNQMKIFRLLLLTHFAAAIPWSKGYFDDWIARYRLQADPTYRSFTREDQTSETIDKVMDEKGWPKCDKRNRWVEEFPWNVNKGQNQCRGFPEWDEYRHYLLTKFAKDICDGTVVDWDKSYDGFPEFIPHACSFCYKSQYQDCTIDNKGYTELDIDLEESPIETVYYVNAPRNLALCSGSPPVCPGDPPVGAPHATTTTSTSTTSLSI